MSVSTLYEEGEGLEELGRGVAVKLARGDGRKESMDVIEVEKWNVMETWSLQAR